VSARGSLPPPRRSCASDIGLDGVSGASCFSKPDILTRLRRRRPRWVGVLGAVTGCVRIFSAMYITGPRAIAVHPPTLFLTHLISTIYWYNHSLRSRPVFCVLLACACYFLSSVFRILFMGPRSTRAFCCTRGFERASIRDPNHVFPSRAERKGIGASCFWAM